MESTNTTLKLTKEVVHQQHHLKEAISIAVKEDCDVCIVSKDNKTVTCQRSLLVLYSPLIASILSSLPCCLSPTIFLPHFQEQHIRRFLHLLGSGQTIAGQNINADMRIIAKIAEVLQIPMTGINIGTYMNNPLSGPFQFKKEVNNFSVKEEIKEEVGEINVKKATESSSEKYDEIGRGEYFEENAIEKIIRRREEADIAHPKDSFASFNDEDPIDLNQEKNGAGLENKGGQEQTKKLSVQVFTEETGQTGGEQFMQSGGSVSMEESGRECNLQSERVRTTSKRSRSFSQNIEKEKKIAKEDKTAAKDHIHYGARKHPCKKCSNCIQKDCGVCIYCKQGQTKIRWT